MNEFLDRVLGFMPYRGTIWVAVAFLLFLFFVRWVANWLIEVTKLPWMEQQNQLQRKNLEQEEK